VSRDSAAEFYEHVQELVTSVGDVSNSSFQKVLYLVLIDGLSSQRFPEHRGPADRFVGFVNCYGAWADCSRISLPQADLLLRETPGIYPALLSAVSARLAKWQEGRFHDLNADPLPDELPDPDGILRDCQHGRLLWALRNTFLHEFRQPGYAFDNLSPGRVNPYYHLIDFVEGSLAGQSGWELVIPTEFLKRLTTNCLEGLVAWMRSENIDPKLIGYQGRSWVTRLRRLNFRTTDKTG